MEQNVAHWHSKWRIPPNSGVWQKQRGIMSSNRSDRVGLSKQSVCLVLCNTKCGSNTNQQTGLGMHMSTNWWGFVEKHGEKHGDEFLLRNQLYQMQRIHSWAEAYSLEGLFSIRRSQRCLDTYRKQATRQPKISIRSGALWWFQTMVQRTGTLECKCGTIIFTAQITAGCTRPTTRLALKTA